MRRIAAGLGAALLLAVAVAVAAVADGPAFAGRDDEPEQVRVQHILIGFKKKVPGKELDRTKKEAETLAEELARRARAGEDFDALVREYTDDRYPGIYLLGNDPDIAPPGGYARGAMAANFGKVAFELAVGEIGIANYHPGNCPYGYHVIKRLE